MASTARRVREYLEGDLVLERALERGVLNLRRTARWLVEEQNWESTEEAVVSALRRHQPEAPHASVRDGYALLRGSSSGFKTGFASITIRNNPWIKERFEEVLDQISCVPNASLSSRKFLTYILPKWGAEAIQEKDLSFVKTIIYPLSRLDIQIQSEDPASGMALAIILNTLSHRGIPVMEFYSSEREHVLYVRSQHTGHVHDLLLHLRDPD